MHFKWVHSWSFSVHSNVALAELCEGLLSDCSWKRAGPKTTLALYPGLVGGERWPGIDCLRMHDHSKKNLGIRLCLEIVSKINMYTSNIFPHHGKIQPFASQITFNSMNVEDNRRVYEAKDAFLQLPTSFGKSVRYEVLSFAWLTVNKASWVEGRVATPLSCYSRRWGHLRLSNLTAWMCIVLL